MKNTVFKILISSALVAMITVTLIFAVPATAFTITFSKPALESLGNTLNFQTTLNIQNDENILIRNITLHIYSLANASGYYDYYSDLPSATTNGYTTFPTSGTGNSAFIKAIAGDNWGHDYGYGNGNWNSTPNTFNYGCSYHGGTGATSITYEVIWTSPDNWPAGNYVIEVSAAITGNTFTQISSFTLSVAGATTTIITSATATSGISTTQITPTCTLSTTSTGSGTPEQCCLWPIVRGVVALLVVLAIVMLIVPRRKA